MKQIFTCRARIIFKICLVFSLTSFSMVLGKTSSARVVNTGFHGSNSGILIIILTPLKGSYVRSVSHLSWTTLQESNSNYFQVQRSIDGVNFSDLGKITAVGSSDRETTYGFDDIKAMPGYDYYRLKYFDKDGQSQLSNVVVIHVDIKGINITGIYPDPFIDKVNVTICSEVMDEANIRLFDYAGKLVNSRQATVRKGVTNIILDNLNSLMKGCYVIKVQVGELVLTRKLVK